MTEAPPTFTWEAPFPCYAIAWSEAQHSGGERDVVRVAVGSFNERRANELHVLELDLKCGEWRTVGGFRHMFPATGLQWRPRGSDDVAGEDVFVSTSDLLRVFRVQGALGDSFTSSGSRDISSHDENESTNRTSHISSASTEDSVFGNVSCVAQLSNPRNQESRAPLTSVHWNRADKDVLGVSSIDGTCTIWDVRTSQIRAQLIAHDESVYDLSFAPHPCVFGSVSRDSSVRIFDLRALEHSTILYEGADKESLIRVDWNQLDRNYVAVTDENSDAVTVLDIRSPGRPLVQLHPPETVSVAAQGGNTPVDTCTRPLNAVHWAPHHAQYLVSAGVDCTARLWNVSTRQSNMAYTAPKPIEHFAWNQQRHDYLAMTFASCVHVVAV
ncbi:MAG: hypothetical protein MHM6MM_005906 [Cercozoa sp. M6MM]